MPESTNPRTSPSETANHWIVYRSNAMSVAAFVLGLLSAVFVVFPSLRLVALAPALLGGMLGVISRGHRHNSIVAAESFAALGTAFCGFVAFFVLFTSAQTSS